MFISLLFYIFVALIGRIISFPVFPMCMPTLHNSLIYNLSFLFSVNTIILPAIRDVSYVNFPNFYINIISFLKNYVCRDSPRQSSVMMVLSNSLSFIILIEILLIFFHLWYSFFFSFLVKDLHALKKTSTFMLFCIILLGKSAWIVLNNTLSNINIITFFCLLIGDKANYICYIFQY